MMDFFSVPKFVPKFAPAPAPVSKFVPVPVPAPVPELPFSRPSRFSRSFLLFLFLALAITFSGCQQSGAPKERNTLQLNVGTEPPTLDPRKATDLTSGIILKMLYDGLTRLAPNGKSRPSIAKSISVSDDLKTYTFKLREAQWSNGDPLTAHDFEYSWKWTLDPNHPAGFAYQLYVIKNAQAIKEGRLPMDQLGVKVLDDTTLVVELEHPTPYFLELTSLMVYYPYHRKMDEDAASHQDSSESSSAPPFISNGPFTLASWKHNDEIVVEKNLNYWDKDSVKLNAMHLLMIPDANTELNMFERGELDWAGTPLSLGLPSDAIPELKESGQLHIKPEAATYFYELNTEKPPLNNLKLRKALAYAINRKAIVENITQANQIPATGILPPPLALQSGPYFQDGDVEAARKLFDEALEELHLTKETFPPISLSFNTSEGHSKIAQAVQQQLRKALGIQIVLENLEWKVYLDQLRSHQYEMGRMSWIADFNDPIAFLETFKYKTNATNNTGWENPEYVRLLNEASLEGNYKTRREILHQAEKVLIDDMPIIPVYYLMNSYLKNPKLQNVYLSGLGDIDFKWAYLEE